MTPPSNISADWNHEQSGTDTSPEQLIRTFMRQAAEDGWRISPSRCSRIIRRAMRRSDPNVEKTIEDTEDEALQALLFRCMNYRDPTGEDAAYGLDATQAADQIRRSRERLEGLFRANGG